MKTFPTWIALSFISLAVPACGSGGAACEEGVPSSSDPRCSELCTPKEPSIKGIGEICSTASATQCVALCEKQIEGASSICASCLLEKSYLSGAAQAPSPKWLHWNFCPMLTPGNPGGSMGVSGWEHSCHNDSGTTTCTIKSPSDKRCDYSFSSVASCDSSISEDCFRKLAPRTEVACTTDFRDTTECASVCGG